jgi:hypothetical protein
MRQVIAIINLLKDPQNYLYAEGYGSFGLRFEYLKQSILLFIDKPILGNGFGSFADLALTIHKYPHNVPLEILAETGLIGFSLILAIIISIKKKSPIKWLGYFGLIALLTSGDFSYFRYGFFFLLLSVKPISEIEEKN